ncbi:MAG TPA: hypothetical protein VER55_09575 [Ardenticatenaceae bacterium]|nr:hypothetical protein [Ardenticatenaceae bacterium]
MTARGILLRLLLAATLAAPALLGPAPVRGQEAPAVPISGTAPAPLNTAGVVVLASHTLDATIVEAEDCSLYADVRTRTRLHNTSTSENAQPFFGWPFWPGDDLSFDPAGLPGFSVTRDGGPLALQPQVFPATFGDQTRDATTWLVTEQPIGRDERVTFDSSWRQTLAPPGSVLVTFRYGLLPAGRWAAPIGSARITLQLPELTDQEQIVSATPRDLDFRGDVIEWLLVEAEPASNIVVTLIAPAVWRDLRATRETIAADPANVDARLHLADLYQRLADAGVRVYEAEVEATLLAARDAAPDHPEPHWRLAQRYRARVGSDRDPDLRYLQLTADELDAALAAGLDPERAAAARELVIDVNRRLADLWLEQGDTETALTFLDRASRWAEGSVAEDIAARRREIVSETILEVLERDGLDAALAVADAQGLPTHADSRSPLGGLDLRLETGPQGRHLIATFTGDPDTVADLAAELQPALSRVPAVAVAWEPGAHGGTLDVRWGTGQPASDWAATGVQLAEALPAVPALDLLRSVLAPAELTYQVTILNLRERFEYRERIALTSRAAERASATRGKAEDAEDAWEQVLLERYASEWESFGDAQSVVYEVTFEPSQGQPLQRRWQPPIPTDETLAYSVEPPLLVKWLQLLGAGVIGLLAAIALIWRWPVYR